MNKMNRSEIDNLSQLGDVLMSTLQKEVRALPDVGSLQARIVQLEMIGLRIIDISLKLKRAIFLEKNNELKNNFKLTGPKSSNKRVHRRYDKEDVHPQ